MPQTTLEFIKGIQAFLGYDKPPTLPDFQEAYFAWVKATFPDETLNDWLVHFAEEVDELKRAPSSADEIADCFMFLLLIAKAANVDILAAAQGKLEKNQRRTWKKTKRATGTFSLFVLSGAFFNVI